MTRKKILFVIESGEPRYYANAIEWLISNTKCSIYIYNIYDNEIAKDVFIKLIGGENYYFLDKEIPYYRSVFAIKKAIKKINPDIIHTHISNCAFYAQLALILSLKKIPLIYHKHNVVSPGFKVLIMEYFSALLCTKIVCVSRSAFDVTIVRWKIFKNKIVFIYNGINLNKGEKDTEIPDLPDNYVLLLARLREDKQHHIAIDAFEILTSKYPDVKLLIAGDGPYKEFITAYIKNKNLSEQVILIGHVTNISQVIKKSLFMLFPSKNESFGLVAVEGMAAKKMVIAKNIGGLAEIITHNETGVLIDNDIPQKWGEQIEYYLNNTIERDRIATAGYNYYNLNFSSDIMAENYYKLYLDLLKN